MKNNATIGRKGGFMLEFRWLNHGREDEKDKIGSAETGRGGAEQNRATERLA